MAFPNTLSMVFLGNIDGLSTGKWNALKPSETISASCAQTWWLSWQAIITLVHVWCTQRASEDRSPVFWNSLAPTQQNALPLKRSSLTESSESTSFESLNQSEDRIASEALLKMLSELPTPYCSSKPSTVTLLGGIHSKTHPLNDNLSEYPSPSRCWKPNSMLYCKKLKWRLSRSHGWMESLPNGAFVIVLYCSICK